LTLRTNRPDACYNGPKAKNEHLRFLSRIF
jgi:hypothetical protein